MKMFPLALSLAASCLASPLFANPITDPDDFPITVWLQSSRAAEQYRDAGFNAYCNLVRKGDWESELATLKANDLYLITGFDEEALESPDSNIIIAWAHGDEPDNAQRKPDGDGYDPPIEPSVIVEDYEKIKNADPTRPVLLNLSQGVAWAGWWGRGTRTNHPEDYAEYAKGADIVSYDIYPATHRVDDIRGKLEIVAYGIDRLKEWAPGKPVWTYIECTRINNPDILPTPDQTRAIVWMSLIHGVDGLIYFSHQFKPNFIEAGLLADPEMTAAVTVMNKRIRSLAPVLKRGQDASQYVEVTLAKPDSPIDTMIRRGPDGALYIFAVNMRNVDNAATFSTKLITKGKIEVLDEDRSLALKGGVFSDAFGPYAVHLYRITAPRN